MFFQGLLQGISIMMGVGPCYCHIYPTKNPIKSLSNPFPTAQTSTPITINIPAQLLKGNPMLQFNRISQMENKSPPSTLSASRSQNILKKYHQLTSPLVSLQSAKRQQLMKDELRQNVSMKLDCIKNRGSKIYALDNTISYSDLKAGAVLYQIPEFSTPQVNFEVSDQIRRRVEEARKEIINYLPEISRSSNYAPKKIEHQLNHRSAVRELQEWLNDKLKNPPVNSEESIEYKNMIMGVGMKELIRIIGKRCSQEGRMAEEIWELTWSICRQIILYLSKRAKKCEQLLEEELSFMRVSYEKEYERLNTENAEYSKKIDSLQEENKEFLSQLVKLRKRRQNLQEENKELTFNNYHLQGQFKKVLQENLAIYLQIGDKNKRGWIKKMYKNINALPEEMENAVKAIFKQEVADVIEERVKLEEITGDCEDPIDVTEIQAIGNRVAEKQGKKKRKNKAKKVKRVSKAVQANDGTMITTPENLQENALENEENDDMSEDSCNDMIQNMREQFLPIDAVTQTDVKQLIDAYASTYIQEFADQSFGVSSDMLGFLEEMGVNTEEIKEENTKVVKKKGKENSKEESRKQKSKIYNGPPIKQKPKPKAEKDKKSILDIVQQINHFEESKVQEKEETFSMSNEAMVMQNNSVFVEESKTDLSNKVQVRAFNKKNSVMVSQQHQEITIKTNSAILSPAMAMEIRQKTAVSGTEPSKRQSKDVALRKLEENLTPGFSLFKNMEKESNSFINSDSSRNEKQVHSMSFDAGITKIKENEKRASKLEAINECSIYICAECNKILTTYDQKYQIGKNAKEILEQKKSARASPNESLRRILPEDDMQGENNDKRLGVRKLRKDGRKNSSYIHDIGFKKQMEEQQYQQQQQQVVKSPSYNITKDQTLEKYDENYEEEESSINVYNKVSPYMLFFTQLLQGNKNFIQGISNAPQQIAQNLEHYFEMVREINALSQSKINLSEKSTITIIEKNIFPILNELLVTVKKSVKTNHIYQTMQNFTSLPNIVYNRITRKYGVKILAIKNLKILLMALKCAGKYTDKYKIIELMLFTDCKSPHSQDLFMYLFIMALYDPNFTSNKAINQEQAQTVRKICEDYLTKEQVVYQQFDKLIKEQEAILLSNLIKSIITNYRLLKINIIQEVGFVYLMLKKDHHMTYKKFIYFLATLNIPHNKKLKIAKRLLEFCDIKNKDQKIGISEIMFSKFLMNCPDFNFSFLEETVNIQLQHYKASDKGIVDLLSTKFFRSQKEIKTNFQFESKAEKNRSSQQQTIRQSISIIDSSDITILSPNNDSSLIQTQAQERVVQNITVLKQIKQYSSFTYHICKYLENNQQTKYLSFKQHLFIKNYLIVHIIESEIQKTVGLVDYFSNSMLETVTMPVDDFNIASSRRN